jgi:zinc protease
MEADRMGWFLPALSAERFEAQRGVVINERRQSYENRPYGLAQFVMARRLYPDGHPYSWPTIGEPADLRAATVDDARAFFTRHYHPGNASLAIAGAIATRDAIDLARELFGAIPPGEPVPPVTPPPMTAAPARLALEDRVELPRLYLAWPSPPLFGDGDAELDLAADLLANGRTSRLYRELIHDRRVATELAASQGSREIAGSFQIMATAAPGHSLADLETAIFDAIGTFAATGPKDDELERGRIQAESAFVSRLQTLGGFGGKTDQLNAYNVYLGKPDYAAADLQRYLRATRESVRGAVARWIDPAAAVALSVVPLGRLDLALPESVPVSAA